MLEEEGVLGQIPVEDKSNEVTSLACSYISFVSI